MTDKVSIRNRGAVVARNSSEGHEERTRLVCHLPLNNAKESRAVNAMFDFLESLRTKKLGVTGYTHSAARPPAYFGAWWSSTRRDWVHEKVVLCIVDCKIDFNDPALSDLLAEVREQAKRAYVRFTGKPQEEFWIVAHHIVR